MNAIKTHFVAKKKKGQVEYGYVGSQWNFRIGKYILMYRVRGGLKVADKIAEAIHKAVLRCGQVDGKCRVIINRLLKVRTLADWSPDTDWWSNEGTDGQNVPMIYINQREELKGFGPEDLAEVPAEMPNPAVVEAVS